MITWYAILGYFGTALAILTYIPQTVKTVKQKTGGNLSKYTFISLFFGCAFWAVFAGLLKYSSTYADALPGWITNIVIFMLMFPILWYVLNDKKLFLLISASASALMVLSIIFMFSGVITYVPEAVKYVFIVCAGIMTGLPFIPQSIRVVKDRKIGNVSVLTIALLISQNIFWILYWSGMAADQPTDGTRWLSIVSSALAMFTAMPTIVIFAHNKWKARASHAIAK